MGFRIVYGKKKHRFHKGVVVPIVLVALSAFLLAALHFRGRQLLPEAALENMVEAVQDGESISDAITAFCREIIDSAQIYD